MFQKIFTTINKRIVFGFLIGVVLFTYFSNSWIKNSTKAQLYNDISKIPFRKVALVLGTSKNTQRGNFNLYFRYRMEAAYQLYVNHKVNSFILSGDNHIKGYDEPSDMQDALMQLGVPDTCMVLDYAGFRTFDSVIRCKEVFGEDSITIVSQPFHNQRAVFIANKNAINALGFNAQEVTNTYSFKTRVREIFAKTKCILDIYVLNTKPKFL